MIKEDFLKNAGEGSLGLFGRVVNSLKLELHFVLDAALLRRYGEIELTREQYDAYSRKVTLTGVYGLGKDIDRKHPGGYGIPMGIPRGQILAELLTCLKERGGVTLPAGSNTPLGGKVYAALSAGRSNGYDMMFPEEYIVSCGYRAKVLISQGPLGTQAPK